MGRHFYHFACFGPRLLYRRNYSERLIEEALEIDWQLPSIGDLGKPFECDVQKFFVIRKSELPEA
jgi:hypothetical protein